MPAPPDIKPASEFLGSIVDALPNPVFVKDEQHRWVVLNDALCRMMGHSREELLGKSDYDYFPKEEADVFWRKDDVVFATGQLDENEELFTDATGRVHVILTRKTLHVDAAGRRFLLGVITDITERKEMESELRRSRNELDERVTERTAELQRANEQLREEARRKNEFLGVLSHELRNPLAPVVNALHILGVSAPDSDAAARAREIIGRQVDHLTRLVDDLLDVTRIARGKIRLKRERLDVLDVVRRAAEDHRPLFAARGIDLHVDLASGPLPVEGDAVRIAQVLGNLLHNAAKFTPRGGRVTVTARADAEGCVIHVEDTGAGIAAHLKERIFEPFVQAEEGLSRTAGGLGLGLALAKGLVVLHGGRIEARSEPGHGTRFEVRLPLAAGVAAPARRAEITPHVPLRVLVVEDNLDAAETLQVMLEMAGHTVAVAHDGRAGLEQARAFRPDVIVCDIGLPEMDGYDVARAIRADECLRQVGLVALTGYALPDDRRRSAAAGFDEHLAKPTSADRIASVISRVAASEARRPSVGAR